MKAVTQPGSSAQSKAGVVNTLGELRVTMGVLPLSCSCAVELPGDGAGPFHEGPNVSFGTLGEDHMLIAASASGPLIAQAESDSELRTMLGRAAVGIRLE